MHSRVVESTEIWDRQLDEFVKRGPDISSDYWEGILKGTVMPLVTAGHHRHGWAIDKVGSNWAVIPSTSTAGGHLSAQAVQGLQNLSARLLRGLWPTLNWSEYLNWEEPPPQQPG